MKILITGINGQVGHALMHHLKEHELVGLTRQDCDLYQPNQIEQIVDQHQPDLIINPAAFTHTSVALRDAVLAVDKPMIEIHLSNVHRREAFRQHSYFSDIAIGVISGFGAYSYELALLAAHNYFKG